MRATRYDRYRCAQNADHFAHNSPFSAFFAEMVCTLGMTPPRAVISPPPEGGLHDQHGGHRKTCWARLWNPWAAVPVGGGRAWPGFETTRPATHSDTSDAGVEGAGGSGGPGRASRSTTPSRRLACGDLAGGRARRHPEHQRHHKQDHQPSSPPPTGTPSSPAPARTLRRMRTRHLGATKPPGPIGAGRQWR